jgi:hypothetical protein
MGTNVLRKLLLTITASMSIAIAAAQQPSAPAPKIKPNLIPQEKATNPAPSANAQLKTQKNSVGKGKLTVTTTQPVDFWQEQVAFAGGGGGVVTTDFLYDSNVGVVYGYREDDFKCANGQPGYGGILEALYSNGNQLKRPVGSGWYAVELNENRCAAKESGIYGCKFDANGNATECGTATLNSRTGDIDIVAEQ